MSRCTGPNGRQSVDRITEPDRITLNDLEADFATDFYLDSSIFLDQWNTFYVQVDDAIEPDPFHAMYEAIIAEVERVRAAGTIRCRLLDRCRRLD